MKQGENVLLARYGDYDCHLRCRDCKQFKIVHLPIQGRELIEQINDFAREHRHWHNRWGLATPKGKKQS